MPPKVFPKLGTERICSKCFLPLDLNEFEFNKESKLGRRSACRKCIRLSRLPKRLEASDRKKAVYSQKKSHLLKLRSAGVAPPRVCSGCKRDLDDSCFSSVSNQCRDCSKEICGRYRTKNRERYLGRKRELEKLKPPISEEQRLKRNAYRKERMRRLKASGWILPRTPRDKERARLQRVRNPELSSVHKAKRRALLAKANGTFSESDWRTVKTLYDYTCLACHYKEPHIKLSIDHVIPLSRGGANSAPNIQPLCLYCNSKKGTKDTDYRVAWWREWKVESALRTSNTLKSQTFINASKNVSVMIDRLASLPTVGSWSACYTMNVTPKNLKRLGV